MKKLIISTLVASALLPSAAKADDIVIDGTAYPVDTLIERRVGPGTVWRKLRMPTYPLNINMLEVDMTDPSVRVETTQANEKLFGTERLVDAAKRQSAPGHRPFAGANGNFWCVTTSYPFSEYLIGTTFNANLRNGKIITETNCAADQWDRGPEYIGEFGVTPEGKVYSDHFRWVGTVTSDAMGAQNIEGANKLVRGNELVMFNSYYGPATTMKCADQVWRDNGNHWGFDLVHGQATEVYLRLADGQQWTAGRDIVFEVVRIDDNTDLGTLGDFDLALVGRDSRRDALRKLTPGDKVTLNYAWTTLDGTPVEFENMIGGNGQVMIDGQLTELNTISENCALVYSKTGYGTSADHNRMFVFVIDKAGGSAGCTSAVMCHIAKHYGCSNLTNFDSGGSAMMFITDRIVNTTTEGTPRAVANGMFVYSTAPDDEVVTRLEFADRTIRIPTSAAVAPAVLGYNRYGVLVSENTPGVVFEARPEIGSVNADGSKFVAGNQAATGVLTARLGDVTVSKTIEVVEAPFEFLVKEIVIDENPELVEMISNVDGQDFVFKPENVSWSVLPEEEGVNPVEIDSDGRIKALCEGKATLTAEIGDRSASATVSAEPRPQGNLLLESENIDPSSWSISKASTSNPEMTPGTSPTAFTLDFNVTSTRGPRVTLAKDIRLYSLPQYFYITLVSGDKTFSSITLTLLKANETRTTSVELEPVASTSSGKATTYRGVLWEGERDLAIFPLTFKNLQFVPATSGQHHVSVESIETGYVERTGEDSVNAVLADPQDGTVEYYNLQGIRIMNPQPGSVVICRKGNRAEKIKM